MQKREKPSKESELKDVPEFIAKLYHILDVSLVLLRILNTRNQSPGDRTAQQS